MPVKKEPHPKQEEEKPYSDQPYADPVTPQLLTEVQETEQEEFATGHFKIEVSPTKLQDSPGKSLQNTIKNDDIMAAAGLDGIV